MQLVLFLYYFFKKLPFPLAFEQAADLRRAQAILIPACICITEKMGSFYYLFIANTRLSFNTFCFHQVLNPYSPYLDDEKHLGVRLLIKNANEVYDPLLINSDKHSVAKLREINAQTKASVENFW